MKTKTSELTGAALDWAVAKCEGMTDYEWPLVWTFYKDAEGDGDSEFHYSTSWACGGPLIERERLCIGFQHQLDSMYAPSIDPDVLCWARTTAGGYLKYGPTPLIAAMRCVVASKMGDTVDIPEELL